MRIISENTYDLSDSDVAKIIKLQCGTPFPVIRPSEDVYQVDAEFRGCGLHKIPQGCIEFKREPKRWYVKTLKPVSFQLLQKINNAYGCDVRACCHAGGLWGASFLVNCAWEIADEEQQKPLLSYMSALLKNKDDKKAYRELKKQIKYMPLTMRWHIDTVEGLIYLAKELKKYY